ncbi:unnamed protein product [Zymoseptoria tritici ST99CH_3D7]|uniref:AB hydrolase-1 domain-containing protein n=1 Tax=Zymoseptoria tritici (strain ST99CH_3D7) TaxID=1276538 RepID=A0A1X7S4Z5_ZYMT9|nr:unnamed protein product [Zymoseptoria tritici ST99CH_3D7]
MSDPPTTIILVSGAWHTDFHLQPVVPALNKLGYTVKPISLVTAGERIPTAVIGDDIAKVQHAIQEAADAGNNICAIGHSAGGRPCVYAVSKFLAQNPAQKSQMKYLCFLSSFLNTARAAEESRVQGAWAIYDQETNYLTAVRSAKVFYNDMSEEQSKPFVDALVLQRPMETEEEMPSLWKECETLKRVYILLLQDQALYPVVQRAEAEEGGWDVVELDTGHCPFVSQPEVFAKCVDGVSGLTTIHRPFTIIEAYHLVSLHTQPLNVWPNARLIGGLAKDESNVGFDRTSLSPSSGDYD